MLLRTPFISDRRHHLNKHSLRSKSPSPAMVCLLSPHPPGLKTLTLDSWSAPNSASLFSPLILQLRSRKCKLSTGTTSACLGEGAGTRRRREALVQIALSAVSFPLLATGASAETDVVESFRQYEDETNKFRILVPRGWLVGSGESDGIRSITAFYPKEASDSNVSVAITGIGADFTRLESFGNVDAFAESLVSGLDRSWKNPPGVAAKLIDSKASKGLYYIEYTLQNPGEKCRHILSAIGMASNGWYNRLYTVTGQFIDDESEKYRSEIGKVVSSFKLI